VRALQSTTLVCIAALLLLTAARQLLIDPLANVSVNAIWLLIQVLPLLAVIPGVLRLRVTGCFFTVLVGMLYFVHGVQASFGPTERGLDLWGLAEAFLAVALVGFASYAIRALRARSV
jgi:uncharacterized membrane protein